MTTEVPVAAPRRTRPFHTVSTLQMALLVISIACIGCLLLYLGGRNDLWEHRPGLRTLVNNLGSILVVSIALALIWEFIGKRSFAREILETAQTSTDVHAAGITRIGMNYGEDADWEALFHGVQKLDIFVAYGRTWRNSHISKLRKVAETPGARIQVFLPDPNDQRTVSLLAQRFSMSESQLSEAINESRSAFISLQQANGAQVDVYLRKGDMVFSCYRFDSTAVVTLYTHSRERGPVPVIVCRSGGSVYEFIRSELRAIQDQSTLAP